MSLTSILAPERRAAPEGSGPLTPASLMAMFGGSPTAGGRRISQEGGLRASIVYACVLIISDGIAALPLAVYRRLDERNKERATNHPLYAILHDEPNPWMSSLTLRQTLQSHLLLWGNAFAEIMRDDNGQVTGLFPLRPDRMARPKLAASGGLLYPYTLPGGQTEALPSNRVLHLRGLAADGIWGYSPIQMQRESISLALTGEEFTGRFFGNSANPGGVLEAKGKLSEEGATRLATSWNVAHQGLANSHRVAVLEEGVTWKQVGMPLQDAQLLEMRKFQRTEIAGWYRVPPHMVGDTEKSTSYGQGIEQQSISFVKFTLMPWLVNWEQELARALLTAADRRTLFVEHIVDGLLRGDMTARKEYESAMLDRGVFSLNDVRALENLNPVEGGDERFVQANMVPLSMAGEQFQQQPAPAADQQQNSLAAPVESRAAQSDRLHLREVYRPLFRDLAERIVKREAEAIRGEGFPHLEQRTADGFAAWLDTYYRDDLSAFIVRVAGPVLEAYGSAVERSVLAELDLPALSESLSPFLKLYGDDLAKSYLGRSRAQLREVVAKALAEQEDVGKEIDRRLQEWLDTRPDKIADIESVRAGEAVAHKTYSRAGVTRLVWRASGGRDECAFCAHLNGKVVGIRQSFAADGDELPGKPGEPPLKVRGPKLHAPIHLRCRCHIGPA